MKFIRYIALFFVTAPLYADPISEIKTDGYVFNKLFDRDLYRLDITNSYDSDPLDPNPDLVLDQPLDEDVEQKWERLEKRKLNKLQQEKVKPALDFLAELNKSTWSKTFQAIADKGWKAGATYVSGGALKAGVSKMISGATEEAVNFSHGFGAASCGAYVLYEAALWYFAENGQREKSIELDAKIKVLLTKLQNEDIRKEEKQYIETQHLYNQEWQNAIEKTLLDCRREPSSFSEKNYKDKLQKLLSFPLISKSLPPDYDANSEISFPDAVDSFIKKAFLPSDIPTEKSLDYYDGETRAQLEEILEDFCQTSQNAIEGKGGKTRQCAIFYGPPGGGKSIAARLLAHASQLPVYELDFAGASDFGSDKLYGTSSALSSNEGHFPTAFLTKDQHGASSKNIVIVVDDIDRAFSKDKKDGEKTLNAAELLKVLLKITDPETSSFDAKFFEIPHFDMSQLHIILTVNTDLEGNDEFDALLSRCKFVRFKPAESEKKKQRIKNYLTDLKLSRQKLHHNKKDLWPDLRQNLADFIVDFYDLDDARKVEQRVDMLLMKSEQDWESFAQSKKWKKTDIEEE